MGSLSPPLVGGGLRLRRLPALRRFQTRSRTTASSAIATMAANVSGSLRSVSTAKNTSTIAVTAIAASTIAPRESVSARRR